MLWTVIIGKYKVVKYQSNVEQTNKMFTELFFTSQRIN